MKLEKLVVVINIKILLFSYNICLINSQRTISRQGISKDPPTVKIPDQGILLGREVNIKKKKIHISDRKISTIFIIYNFVDSTCKTTKGDSLFGDSLCSSAN